MSDRQASAATGVAGVADDERCHLSRSEDPRREFKITRCLRAGYGSSGRIYGLGKAVRTHSATARMNGGPVIDPNSDEPTKPSPI